MAEPHKAARDEVPWRTTAGTFFAIALGWSILWWSAAALLGGMEHFGGQLLFYAGGGGPLLAALLLTHVHEPRSVQRDFWARIVDPRRMRLRWLTIALVLHPALVLLALGLDLLLGGELAIDTAALSSARALLGLAVFVFLFGPLPEEIGWRGFALDRLQARMTPLNASLVLGAAWALWHFPLFFIDGTFQHDLGARSIRFWIFSAALFPLCVIITWVYNHTSRSTLSAVLVHFSGNLMGAVLQKSDRVAALELALLATFAALIVLHPRAGFRKAESRKGV